MTIFHTPTEGGQEKGKSVTEGYKGSKTVSDDSLIEGYAHAEVFA